jgi:hypothetical protein
MIEAWSAAMTMLEVVCSAMTRDAPNPKMSESASVPDRHPRREAAQL